MNIPTCYVSNTRGPTYRHDVLSSGSCNARRMNIRRISEVEEIIALGERNSSIFQVHSIARVRTRAPKVNSRHSSEAILTFKTNRKNVNFSKDEKEGSAAQSILEAAYEVLDRHHENKPNYSEEDEE